MRLTPGIGDRGVDQPIKLLQVMGSQVGQVRILCVVPDLLQRVEVGGVGTQLLQVDVVTATLHIVPHNRCLVDASSVEDDHDLACYLCYGSQFGFWRIEHEVILHHVQEEILSPANRLGFLLPYLQANPPPSFDIGSCSPLFFSLMKSGESLTGVILPRYLPVRRSRYSTIPTVNLASFPK